LKGLGGWKRFLPLLLGPLALAYCLWGVFPVTPFEEDGTAIAAGALLMGTGDLSERDGDLVYRYDAQPGAYALAGWGKRLLGLDPFAVLSWTSALSSCACLVLAGILLGRLTGCSLLACCGLLALFQETWASGFYPNSTMLAAPWLLSALLLSASARSRPLLLLAGASLAVGGWFRTDMGLISLSFPVLRFWLRGRDRAEGAFREAFWDTAVIGASCLALLPILFAASRSSPFQALAFAKGHLLSAPLTTPALGIPWVGAASIKSHLAFFPLGPMLLFPVGLVLLARGRDRALMGLVLAGGLPMYLAYAGQATTPKYFFPLLPFALLPCLAAWRWAWSLNRPCPWIKGTALACLLLSQPLLGFQASFRSKPWVGLPEPTVLTFLSKRIQEGPVRRAALVLGAGSLINTDDGPRLSSGTFFLPGSWRLLKEEHRNSLLRIERELLEPGRAQAQERPRLCLVSGSTRGWRALLLTLLRQGYRLEEKTTNRGGDEPLEIATAWGKDGDRVELVYREMGHRQWELFSPALQESRAAETVYVVDRGWEEALFLQNESGWRKLCGETGLYMLAAYARLE